MFKYLVFSLACFVLVAFSGNRSNEECVGFKRDLEMVVALKVNANYRLCLKSFLREINRFDSLLESDVESDVLKTSFLKMRQTFKSSEFLLCYSESDEVRRINGANLAINEYHAETPMDGKQPHGLQVMESLVYNQEEGFREDLKKEVVLLEALIGKILDRNLSMGIADGKEYNSVVWDAIRLELFRVETLGITGFDVPESLNSLPETKAVFHSLQKNVRLYEVKFKEKKLGKDFAEGMMLFDRAQVLLGSAADFNSFDRLSFMTEVLHPLQRWVKRSSDELEYIYLLNLKPIDNKAAFLYDSLFFNPAYFSDEMTPEKVALGKKLFNDSRLSADGSRSCASCHQQGKGLADGLIKNNSIDGGSLLKRNTPTLLNAGFQTRFFYDSRAKRLEIQVMDVIHNPLEMGADVSEIASLIKDDPQYKELFLKTYKGVVTKSTIANALADYVRSLVSFNSRFDRYLRGERTLLSESEKRGFNVFSGKAKCATCHFAPLFNGLLPPFYKDNESEILGVPMSSNDPKTIDPDLGKFDNTRLELHKYAFKTVTVRNVELTGPYMHNGVFKTLEEVVEFYEKGGGAGQGMDLPSQTLPGAALKLTEPEKRDLVHFLKALTYEP